MTFDQRIEKLKNGSDTAIWAANEIERLQKTLEQYANPLNWDEDHQGIRRVWLEPGSTTPEAYNGFEAARFVLTHNTELTGRGDVP